MSNFLDLTGERFGRLIALERTEPRIRTNGAHISRWKCVCDCGKEIVTDTRNLTSGDTRSCGCLKADLDAAKFITHGHSKERLYKIWKAMRKRCNNPANSDYARYGGRGIQVCTEWNNYSPFREWAISNGYNDDLTIDRIDVNGDYCPDNCRWVSRKVQSNNRSNTLRFDLYGEVLTIPELAAKYNMKYTTLYNRLARGLSVEEAIQPFKTKKIS